MIYRARNQTDGSIPSAWGSVITNSPIFLKRLRFSLPADILIVCHNHLTFSSPPLAYNRQIKSSHWFNSLYLFRQQIVCINIPQRLVWRTINFSPIYSLIIVFSLVLCLQVKSCIRLTLFEGSIPADWDKCRNSTLSTGSCFLFSDILFQNHSKFWSDL